MASNRRKLKVQPSPIIPPRLRQKIASIASLNNIYPVNLKSPTGRVKTTETYFQQTNVARRSFPANRPLTSRSKSAGQPSFDPTDHAETAGLHFKASGCLMIGALAGTPSGKPTPSSPSSGNDISRCQAKSQRESGMPSRPSTAPNPNCITHNEDPDVTIVGSEYTSIAGRVLPIREAVFEMPRTTACSASTVGKFAQPGTAYLAESTKPTPLVSSHSLSQSEYGLLSTIQGKALPVNSEQLTDLALNCDDPSQCERVNLNRKSLHKCPILQNEDFIRLLNYQNNHISKIEHLELLGNLVFLDMYNNHIEKISGLETLFSLRVLMLGRNRIKKIENLNSLHKLDVLDLHRNQISVIENISHLRELRVLNLEDNKIKEASNFAGLDSLAEFNLSRNQIHAVHDIHRLSNLRRFLLSDNSVSNSDDIADILRLPNIVEFSLENNPLSQENFYRPLVVFRMRTLKVLDSRRVLEEERRNAGKVARKEAEKRKENERVVAQQEERKRVIEFIKSSWEDGVKLDRRIDMPDPITDATKSLRVRDMSVPFSRPQTAPPPARPGSSSSRNWRGPLSFDDAQKMNDNQNSYTELNNGVLHIYGQGLTMIDKLETSQVISMHLNYINVTTLASFFPKLRRFPNLKSLHMSNNNFSELKQVHYLCGLRNLEILDISRENNPAVDLPSFRSYVIFRLGHVPLRSLCGLPVTPIDVEHAVARYDGLYRVTLAIPRSILSKTSDHVLPINVFDDDDKLRVPPNGNITQNDHFTRMLESGYNIESRKNGRYNSFSHSYTENLIGEAITTTNKLHLLSTLWPNAVEDACRDTLQQYCRLGPEEYFANILKMIESTPEELAE